MRIAFINLSNWDYTVETPYERPLGGSQSALCYLAEQLAALGHEVSLLNNVTQPRVTRGVQVCRADGAPLADLQGCDAIVVMGWITTALAETIRREVGREPVMVHWSQHAHDQPALADLKIPAMRAVWDGFALVSQWQARCFEAAFAIPSTRIRVMRNAVSPFFAELFPADAPILPHKPWPPVLCYTSTPFRGLDVLLDAFPLIREAVPGTTLKVFSSMGVYQVPTAQDDFTALYERCRTTDGVTYIGSLPQRELAEELKGITALAYPNTFPETSCIAVMEALAAGCLVVTSELGALPETTAGFGFLMPLPADRSRHARDYADLAIRVLKRIEGDPEAAERHLRAQVNEVNTSTTWPIRAHEWADWLHQLRGGQGAVTPAAD